LSRTASSMLQLGGGRVVSAVLQLAAFTLTAAALAKPEFGRYAFALASAEIVRAVTTLGYQSLAVRDLAQAPTTESETVPAVFVSRLAWGTVVFGAAVAVSYSPVVPEAYRAGVAVAALVGPIVAFDTFRATLDVRLKMGWTAVAGLLESGILLSGTILVALTQATFVRMLVVYVVANLASAVVICVAARPCSFHWGGSWRRALVELRRAAPLGVAALVISGYTRIDVFLLGAWAGRAAVGEYGVAYRFVDAAAVIPVLVMSVVAPALATGATGAAGLFRRRFQAVLHVVAVPAFAFTIGGSAMAWSLLPEVPGLSRYEGGAMALTLLCPAIGFALLNSVVQRALISAGHERSLVPISIAALVLNVTLNVVAIRAWSFAGAAVVTSITEAFLLVVSMAVLHRRTSLAPSWRGMGSVVLATAPLALGAPLTGAWGAPGAVLAAAGLLVGFAVFKPVSLAALVRLLRGLRSRGREQVVTLRELLPQVA
jgi:O-antigen/teichoic acid export membrane protein